MLGDIQFTSTLTLNSENPETITFVTAVKFKTTFLYSHINDLDKKVQVRRRSPCCLQKKSSSKSLKAKTLLDEIAPP